MNPYEELPEALDETTERELLRLDRSDLEIRNKLLLHTLKDAIKYASSCCRGMLPIDELMSLCSVALIKAIDNYDLKHPSKLRLMPFAKAYIRGQIQIAWRDRNPVEYGHDIPEQTQNENADIASEERDYADPAFDLIDMHEKMEWVKPHLDKLSETERRVLILRFEGGFSLAEIGQMLSCTRQNILMTQERALKKIRNGLFRERKFFVK